LSQKRHFFAEFFGENILKMITSVPDEIVQKIGKNVAQPIFLSKLMYKLNHEKELPKNVGYFFNFKQTRYPKGIITLEAKIRPIWSPWMKPGFMDFLSTFLQGKLILKKCHFISILKFCASFCTQFSIKIQVSFKDIFIFAIALERKIWKTQFCSTTADVQYCLH
jgi:hypothetical protein